MLRGYGQTARTQAALRESQRSYGHERPRRPLTQLVQRARHQFLAAARWPYDQHRRRARSDQLRQPIDALHRLAAPNHAWQWLIFVLFFFFFLIFISISISIWITIFILLIFLFAFVLIFIFFF